MSDKVENGPRSAFIPDDQDLPQVGSSAPFKERSDAARNRRSILEAAAELFAERGPEHVSMSEIARRAGVGKGTLYRRFGDKAGLALALLDEDERRLQEAAVRGPAPLGPDASPTVRLVAFLEALVDLLELHTELHLISHHASPGARYRTELYAFYHRHVELLLEGIRSDIDADVLADLLLAPLSADAYIHLRARGLEPDRIKAGLRVLVRRIGRAERSA